MASRLSQTHLQLAKQSVKINDSKKDEINSIEVIRRLSVGMIYFFFFPFSLLFRRPLSTYTVHMQDNTIMFKQYFSFSFSLRAEQTIMIEVVFLLFSISFSSCCCILYMSEKREEKNASSFSFTLSNNCPVSPFVCLFI